VAVVSESGDVIAVNAAWERFGQANGLQHGLAGPGSNYFEACLKAGPRCPEALQCLAGCESVLAGRLSRFEMEYPCDAPNRPRRYLMMVNPLPGQERGLVITHLDMTERRTLELHNQQLAALVTGAAEAIVGQDLDGRITSWNEGAERLFGHAAPEAVGQPITVLVPSERLSESWTLLQRIQRGESVPRLDTVRLAKGGRRVRVSLGLTAVRDAAGKIVGACQIAYPAVAGAGEKPSACGVEGAPTSNL
jgi:PAS domain S-box-containing protein